MWLVSQLLDDIAQHCAGRPYAVTLTINRPERMPEGLAGYPLPLHVIFNDIPKGFGENHNAAFRQGVNRFAAPYYCVLNPDVRIGLDIFADLIRILGQQPDVGIVAPRVVDASLRLENSARRLPTPWGVLKKALTRQQGIEYCPESEPVYPDWVAGMAMLFPSKVFHALGGFDERYFLYYEDVDLCCRAWLQGYAVMLDPSVSVIHDARRESHRNLRYFRYHLASMARFFMSLVYVKCLIRPRKEPGKAHRTPD